MNNQTKLGLTILLVLILATIMMSWSISTPYANTSSVTSGIEPFLGYLIIAILAGS